MSFRERRLVWLIVEKLRGMTRRKVLGRVALYFPLLEILLSISSRIFSIRDMFKFNFEISSEVDSNQKSILCARSVRCKV